MKRGLLLYSAVDAEKNQWFIQHLLELAPLYGLSLTFQTDTELHVGDYASYDFVINRTRSAAVNVVEDFAGVRCFNNARTVEVGNDKWLTYRMCRELGVPVMPTMLAEEGMPDLPCIVKSRDGHGGSDVHMALFEPQVRRLTHKCPHRYILQQPASGGGVDVRVYLLGGQVLAAVKRTSKTDFRSNFSLGGQVERFTPTPEMLDMVETVQQHLHTDYVGMDFLPHKGGWVLNEIEDVVGARMLYSLWDGDVADLFMRHIAEQLG